MPATPLGVQQSSSSQLDLQVNPHPAATPIPSTMKHSNIGYAHKKLASKLKAFASSSASVDSAPAPSYSPSMVMPVDIVTSIPAPSSQATISALPTLPAITLQSSTSTSIRPTLASTRSIVQPTSDVLGDPNPEVRSQTGSDASQRARKTAILAAFLILATLGALGGGVLCFKCGVLPCCHSKDRQRKSRASLERAAEEGRQKPARVVSYEKSIIPGAPPQAVLSDMPILPSGSHTRSCSTCPDSLIGMKSGISGGASSWRVYATNEDGQYEDVTHVLASDTFSVHSAQSGHASAPSYSSQRSQAQSPRHSMDSVRSGSSAEPNSSVHTRTESRASESGASMTAESYKSCESRYSTPSFERHSREGPVMALSPSPPASVSVLLLTPDQTDYVGLADAALPRVVEVTGSPALLETVVESETEDMDLDSRWDLAKTFGTSVQKPQGSAVGRRSPTDNSNIGTVAVGGRTCVLMRG